MASSSNLLYIPPGGGPGYWEDAGSNNIRNKNSGKVIIQNGTDLGDTLIIDDVAHEVYFTDDGVTTANRMSIAHTVNGGTFYYNGSSRMYIGSGGTTIQSFLKVPSSAHIGSTNAPHTTAVLELTSTSKGFLPTRMTGTQADAISSVPVGLTIYCTDASGTTVNSEGLWIYKSGGWTKII